MASLRDIYKHKYELFKKENEPVKQWPFILVMMIGCGIIYWSNTLLPPRYKFSDLPFFSAPVILALVGIIMAVSSLVFGTFAFFSGFINSFSGIIAPRQLVKNFICHNCLKSVVTMELKFTCPFCDEEYASNEIALFDKCPKCKSKIQFISCPHCSQPINLMDEYDEKALEAKRYVR